MEKGKKPHDIYLMLLIYVTLVPFARVKNKGKTNKSKYFSLFASSSWSPHAYPRTSWLCNKLCNLDLSNMVLWYWFYIFLIL